MGELPMPSIPESRVGDQVEATRPCPITGERRAEVVAVRDRHGAPLRNVMSVGSGLVYVDPLPVEDLAAFYREDYRVAYKGIATPKPKHVARAGWVSLERHRHSRSVARPGMKTLDVGAGGGENVYLMSRLGCEARGIEPNLGYGGFAKESYGVQVFLGTHQEADFEPGSFDLVSLYQVLEHLADPVEELRSIARFLKAGGLFLIEVPDILFPGMRFAHKWHDGHLFGYDALTLEAVAAAAGLRKRSVTVLPGNLFGVFEKTEASTLPGLDLDGHFEVAKASLAAARRRYWTLPATYLKGPRRIASRLREAGFAKRAGSPRAILDALYRDVEGR
jgi:SAM-dependent methyltransferase